jgi:hypothetical protein
MLLMYQLGTLCPAVPLIGLSPSWSVPILVPKNRVCSVLSQHEASECCVLELLFEHVVPRSASTCTLASLNFHVVLHLLPVVLRDANGAQVVMTRKKLFQQPAVRLTAECQVS